MYNVKIEDFILDYVNNKLNNVENKTDYICELIDCCNLSSEQGALDKKQLALYFTDEQIEQIREKQIALGYGNNFSRFIRHVLFNDFLNNLSSTPNLVKIVKSQTKESPILKEQPKLVTIDKFDSYINKCEYELQYGKYTSYSLDLLRNNKSYEDKISLHAFDKNSETVDYSADFLEHEMVMFIYDKFNSGIKYSRLIGQSTEQIASNWFLEMKDGNILKPFNDYDNIVPNTDSFYYLFLFSVLAEKFELPKILKLFDETKEHINYLLQKYTFGRIIKYYKQNYGIDDKHKIFDIECIARFKNDNI